MGSLKRIIGTTKGVIIYQGLVIESADAKNLRKDKPWYFLSLYSDHMNSSANNWEIIAWGKAQCNLSITNALISQNCMRIVMITC